MDRTRLAPLAGILACLAFLAALAMPLGSSGGGLYYATGALNPLVGGLFAVVLVVVFAAGRQERTDPALAAGVALAFGLVITAATVVWAVTARTDVLSITRFHRHALLGTASGVPLAAAWYAFELDLF
ncbi:DUF7548 family protein [Halorhabdus rudnickae]|uniref:DUF7548 family protein n=1 Tax=Halorhabdus rudnickae TaxID=1775544 RepID=UPI00108381CD|nr:hypothetical protein [Halorhabdus rudnickae]